VVVLATWLALAGVVVARAQPVWTPPRPTEDVADVLDLWVVNGNALGNAIGAVLGQVAFAPLGPGAWVAGSLVGGVAGGILGEWLDNQVHRAYNYAAFDRPALGEPGSVVLEGAGPWEQFFYQLDSRVLIGGNLATWGTHFGLNLMARTIPGLGGISPLLLGVADYVAGNLGDVFDGSIDLAALGERLDARDDSPPSPVGTSRMGAPREYDHLLEALRTPEDRARIRRRWERLAHLP
jgi:hypothetical protein